MSLKQCILPLSSAIAFDQCTEDELETQFNEQLEKTKQCVEEVSQEKRFTWETICEPLQYAEVALSYSWSLIQHLDSVDSNPSRRRLYEACLQRLMRYSTWVGQHEPLYRQYQNIAVRVESHQLNLTPAQLAVVQQRLRDFKLAGVALSIVDRQRYKLLMERLSVLSTTFNHHVLDATQAWTYNARHAYEVEGIPEFALARMEKEAQVRGLSGWILTLHEPDYLVAMSYAAYRPLREAMYRAYQTRASDQSAILDYDNGLVMLEILQIRMELAQLLGYATYAERSLVTKMAPTTEAVEDLLKELHRYARPMAEKELTELRAFAEANGAFELEAWDLNFYSERLRKCLYAVDQEALRAYFPLNRVLKGLFELSGQLFKIRVKPMEAPVWHESVLYFRVEDYTGGLRGFVYFDLLTRPGKRSGAWAGELVPSGRLSQERRLIPITYLVCNFAQSSGEQEVLLTHREVETLFHEWGHILHQLLSTVDPVEVAGTSGVPWDGVELPSQLLEFWCWEPEMLRNLSGHYLTGEPLDAALIERLRAARHFHAGLHLLRQLTYAELDWFLHKQVPSCMDEFHEQVLQRRKELECLPPLSWTRPMNSFLHIFAGGYEAGYYSYLWAEVLAADAFSYFQQKGIYSAELGEKLKREILSVGGSRPFMEAYRAFRGQTPDVKALLVYRGLLPSSALEYAKEH